MWFVQFSSKAIQNLVLQTHQLTASLPLMISYKLIQGFYPCISKNFILGNTSWKMLFAVAVLVKVEVVTHGKKVHFYFNLSTHKLISPHFLRMCNGVGARVLKHVCDGLFQNQGKQSKPKLLPHILLLFHWKTEPCNKEHLLTLSRRPARESLVIIYFKWNKKMSLMQTLFW